MATIQELKLNKLWNQLTELRQKFEDLYDETDDRLGSSAYKSENDGRLVEVMDAAADIIGNLEYAEGLCMDVLHAKPTKKKRSKKS